MDTELIEQTISAAMDGEAVDVELLKRALATAQGRDALAGFVLLRAAAAADVTPAPERVPATIVALTSGRGSWPGALRRYGVPAALAASLAALAVAGGFWLGSNWQAPQVTVQLPPPAATRTVVVAAPSPVVVVEPAVVRPCAPPPEPQPPRPTRVVRYVRGVDWVDATSQ